MKKILSQSINISLFFLLAIVCFGCSENIYDIYSFSDPSDMIRVEILLPVEERISTREEDKSAYQNDINDLTLLFFSQDGKTLLQKVEKEAADIESGSSASNAAEIIFVPGNSLKSQSSPVVYAVANGLQYLKPISEKEEFSAEELENIECEGITGTGGSLIMSAKSIDYSETGFSIALKRNASRITCRQTDEDSKFVMTGMKVFNVADKCYLTAAAGEKVYSEDRSSLPKSAASSDGNFFEILVNPTKTYQSSGDEKIINSFIILEGTYNDLPSYYCLNPLSKEPASSSEGQESQDRYYDFEPNHWYDIELVKIAAAGCSSVEEAIASGADGNVRYIIRDHSPEIVSMISDGVRELGVSGTLNVPADGYRFSIRCVNAGGENPGKPSIGRNSSSEVRIWVEDESATWLSLMDPVEKAAPDADLPGREWSVPFSVSANSSRSAIVNVEWAGLHREIKINYTHNIEEQDVSFLFPYSCLIIHDADRKKGEQLSNSALSRYDDGGESKIVIYEYWNWLRGLEESSNMYNYWRNHRLFGTHPQAGLRRDNGFHFPVMYGAVFNPGGASLKQTPWWYEYWIELDKELFNTSDFEVMLEFETKEGIWKNLHVVDDYRKNIEGKAHKAFNRFFLIFAQDNGDGFYEGFDDGYENSVNYLLFKDPGTGSVMYRVPLYHTGFFHFETNEDNEGYNKDYRVDLQPDNFYYYEVVEHPDGSHWLDRNLGAAAADPSLGNISGGHYYPASYSRYASTAEERVYPDLCPPGYRLPKQAEFKRLFRQSSFTGSAPVSSCLTSKGNPVYFPKDGVITGGQQSEKEETGYYWTSSAAVSTGSTEPKWLSVMKINGSSPTFLPGDITAQAMSVRCIADNGKTLTQDEPVPEVSINMAGATHAYVYYYDNFGTKKGIYQWPGKGLGTPDVMTDINIVNFSFEVSEGMQENLYIIFTYVEDGVTKVLGSDGEGMSDPGIRLADAKGWRLLPGGNYFFRKTGNKFEKNLSLPNAWRYPSSGQWIEIPTAP